MSTVHTFILKKMMSLIGILRSCINGVKKVGSSMYKKQKTTTEKSSFFGLLEGLTLTGTVVIGVGALVVHSVYALYTGEPTL
jgi:hypothetical protein